jgi:glutamate synthase domain-containing protein 3
MPAVEKGEARLARTISNCDRSVGAALSGWLVEKKGTGNGEQGMGKNPDGRTVFDLTIDFTGVAYVYDESGDLDLNCNLDSVDLFPVAEGSDDESQLLALLHRHVELTSSAKAERMLASWSRFRARFAKVVPTSR